MNTDGVHVELTVEGLGRDAFGNAMGWIWDRVDVLFPVITGQWSFEEAVIPAGILAGLALLFRLIVHLADGGGAAQIPRALIVDPHDLKLATWRSHNQWERVRSARADGTTCYMPALASVPQQQPPAPVRERIEVLDGSAMLAHGLFYSLARFYVWYLLLSVLVCWIFGVGDLDIFFAVLGIGGRS